MRARRHFPALLSCIMAVTALPMVAPAEAPLTSLRPEARMIAPPARPLARPGDALALPPGLPPGPAPGPVAAAEAAPLSVERQKAPYPGDPGQLAASETRIEAGVALPPGIGDLAEIFAVALGRADPAAAQGQPPARPDIRLASRPAVPAMLGPPPARPVARAPQPPGPVYFDQPEGPRIFGAATLAPLPDISELAVPLALRPPARPEQITRAAEAARAARARGAVCGNLDIQGTPLGEVPGPGSCGVEGAVRVTSVAGVRLSAPATMDCTTAEALHRWVETGARPAIGNAGGGLASIQVIGHYSCRTRANGSRLSEHAFGRAIDIAGFDLRDGTRINLIRDWNSSPHAARLRQMHRAACSTFGTVLGPDANAAHRDHFHFDTARYRSGSYCR